MLSSPLIENVELLRHHANKQLNPEFRSTYGQYMTPSPIAQFMATLFSHKHSENIYLLDPGAGVGSLTAAFVQEFAQREAIKSMKLTAYERDSMLTAFLTGTLNEVTAKCQSKGIASCSTIHTEDFITAITTQCNQGLFHQDEHAPFTHIIMNPPYGKINAKSKHRLQLRSIGIETPNLYTAFVCLAIRLLQPGGELVAIIPRSFCNGLYFRSFRKILLAETLIRQIHIFESRHSAFKDDDVLQENIIIHLSKKDDFTAPPPSVRISSCRGSEFVRDEASGELTAEDMSYRDVPYHQVVYPSDPEQFIHVVTSDLDQLVIDRMATYATTLSELNLEVSTGPVVDFRLKNDLRADPTPGAVALLYPQHFQNNGLTYPIAGKKPNAIQVSANSERWLWANQGYYVVTKRFTSKEEKKRIVASVYNSSEIDGERVGFENHLNVSHQSKKGLPKALAYGLAIYLNSSLVDRYFRQFSGHTQVNATDLKALKYPKRSTLVRWGAQALSGKSQQAIDDLLQQETQPMTDSPEAGTNPTDPIQAQQKIDEALSILKQLGLPRAQQNERSALTLLALLNMEPHKRWEDTERPLLGITPVMEFCRDVYGKQYAPNTRETFRRQTMHQFVAAAIALYNPDDPGRAVNSPKACYQISPAAFDLLVQYGQASWPAALATFQKSQQSLATQYAKE